MSVEYVWSVKASTRNLSRYDTDLFGGQKVIRIEEWKKNREEKEKLFRERDLSNSRGRIHWEFVFISVVVDKQREIMLSFVI